ncbi:MAG: coproporphyrinogen dehydrogenase HemZ [Clostridia bacterium]|nr:coproporphyrinogen dehydrogenase HemZ [Clostridia bacterium]
MRLYTNREDFYNDLCEVIRLFVSMSYIELCGNPGAFADETRLDNYQKSDALRVMVWRNGAVYTASADFVHNSQVHSYTYRNSFSDIQLYTESENEDTAYLPNDGDDDYLREKRYQKRVAKIAAFRAMRMAYPVTPLPWGSLTGIRPTRLLRDLQDSYGEVTAANMMVNEFDVTDEKLALASRIVSVQRPVLASAKPNEADIYIGIPYCRSRCLYCSFASEIRTRHTDMAPYLDALKKDIALGARLVRDAGLTVRACYVGGGTPTVLTETELLDVLGYAKEQYAFAPGIEFTVEAGRPDTITEEKLLVLKELGVDRISINPQTMNDATLAAVGRYHTADNIRDAFRLARQLGFDNINMDLIAGLPGETAADMERTVAAIEELGPDSLTVHTLAIKRSSRLHEKLGNYELPPVPEVEKMIAAGSASAERMGMAPYYMYRQKYMSGNMENVGYAKPGKLCLYNIDMMEDSLSIIANGAGAMTKRVFPDGRRIDRVPNPKDIKTYIEKLAKTDEEKRRLFGL